MERVNQIVRHPLYNHHLQKNIEIEKNRRFCLHNLQHFLDVARVSYIIALERKLEVSKEIIYATALLHDIGKWQQYLDGRDHATASRKIAEIILRECNFMENDIKTILQAIQKHREGEDLITPLDQVLYEGDKKSRLCVQCESIKECKRFKVDEIPKIDY